MGIGNCAFFAGFHENDVARAGAECTYLGWSGDDMNPRSICADEDRSKLAEFELGLFRLFFEIFSLCYFWWSSSTATRHTSVACLSCLSVLSRCCLSASICRASLSISGRVKRAYGVVCTTSGSPRFDERVHTHTHADTRRAYATKKNIFLVTEQRAISLRLSPRHAPATPNPSSHAPRPRPHR